MVNIDRRPFILRVLYEVQCQPYKFSPTGDPDPVVMCAPGNQARATSQNHFVSLTSVHFNIKLSPHLRSAILPCKHTISSPRYCHLHFLPYLTSKNNHLALSHPPPTPQLVAPKADIDRSNFKKRRRTCSQSMAHGASTIMYSKPITRTYAPRIPYAHALHIPYINPTCLAFTLHASHLLCIPASHVRYRPYGLSPASAGSL